MWVKLPKRYKPLVLHTSEKIDLTDDTSALENYRVMTFCKLLQLKIRLLEQVEMQCIYSVDMESASI